MKTTREGHGASSDHSLDLPRGLVWRHHSWMRFVHIIVLFTPYFRLVGQPPLSVCTSVTSAFPGVAHTSILFGSEVYDGHMTEIPNDCPKGATCSGKRTCQPASDSSLGSAVNQLWDSGQEPVSFEFHFPLG